MEYRYKKKNCSARVFPPSPYNKRVYRSTTNAGWGLLKASVCNHCRYVFFLCCCCCWSIFTLLLLFAIVVNIMLFPFSYSCAIASKYYHSLAVLWRLRQLTFSTIYMYAQTRHRNQQTCIRWSMVRFFYFY